MEHTVPTNVSLTTYTLLSLFLAHVGPVLISLYFYYVAASQRNSKILSF